MSFRLPTRDEVAAARRTSFESIQAIVNERRQSQADQDDEATQSSDDVAEFDDQDRARLEALLLKSNNSAVSVEGRLDCADPGNGMCPANRR